MLGADYNRVCLLLAVLEKRVGFPLQSQDAFVNVAGGARVSEPAADLGLVLAAASSYLDRPLRGDVVVIGEVGLTGEVRAVTGLDGTPQGGGRARLHRGRRAPEQPRGPGEAIPWTCRAWGRWTRP